MIVLNEFSDSGIGCKFDILLMNILPYADDLVILANFSQLSQLYGTLEIRMD